VSIRRVEFPLGHNHLQVLSQLRGGSDFSVRRKKEDKEERYRKRKMNRKKNSNGCHGWSIVMDQGWVFDHGTTVSIFKCITTLFHFNKEHYIL